MNEAINETSGAPEPTGPPLVGNTEAPEPEAVAAGISAKERKRLESLGKYVGELDDHPDSIIKVPANLLGLDAAQSARWDGAPRELKDLAESIAARGQLIPISVSLVRVNDGEEGHYLDLVVQEGYGRTAAIKQLKESRTSFPGGPNVKVALWKSSGQQAFIDGLHTNLKGKNLSAVEVALAVSRLFGEGMDRGEVAKELGISGSSVTQYRKLLKLGPVGRKHVHDGTVPFRAATDIIDSCDSEEEIEAAISELVADAHKAGKKKVSAAKTRTKLREKAGKKGKSKARSLAEIRTEFGTYVEQLVGEHSYTAKKLGEICELWVKYADGKVGGKKFFAACESILKQVARHR